MNSNNNMSTCLLSRSTDQAFNSRAVNGAIPPRLRVLLLEDDEELAELLSLIFQTWGFQPTVARLGQEASHLFQEQEFRLALVDIGLPDTTGFDVVSRALAQGRLRNTRIIFCSSEPSDDRVAMAGRFPGSVFVPKPFEMRNLLPLIQKLLRTN
jgi:DNA-binding response OmpR family regulator